MAEPRTVTTANEVDIDTDTDIKMFIRSSLAEYSRYVDDPTTDAQSLFPHAIGWYLMGTPRIVYGDRSTDMGLMSTKDMIKATIIGFADKIFAKVNPVPPRPAGPSILSEMRDSLKELIDRSISVGGATASAAVGRGGAALIHLLSLMPFPDIGKLKEENPEWASRHTKFQRMRANVDTDVTIDTPRLYENGRSYGEIMRLLKCVRNLLLAFYATSIVSDARYTVRKTMLARDKIPILPEMENRKTPIFEILGLTNAPDKQMSEKLGKYINEALTFYFGYYAACFKRGISAKGNNVAVNDLLVANMFLLIHLCYVMSTDPILQTTLTPSRDNVGPPFDMSDFEVNYKAMLDKATTGGTQDAFHYFCGGPENAIRVEANMSNMWHTELANVSFMESSVRKFLSYCRVRKHHAKILRQASRDVFQRNAGFRITDCKDYMDPNFSPQIRQQVFETMPKHAKYVHFDEDKGYIVIPKGEFIGKFGGGAQRHLNEESDEQILRTLDESINMYDVERMCQFLADRMSGVFESLSKKPTRDTTEHEFEIAGDMALRSFSSVLEDKFQFTRDDYITGPKRDLLTLLNVANDEQFVGEMLEGLLTSEGDSWNYAGNEMTAKMRLYAVVMCGAPLNVYPMEFSDAIKKGLVYQMDYFKVMYMINSVVAVNSTAPGQKLANAGGLPENTQAETLYFIENYSKQIAAEGKYVYSKDDNTSKRLEKIVGFLNDLAVALIRTDDTVNPDGRKGEGRKAKVRFTMMRQTDRMTFGTFIVRRLLLTWLARNILRLMGFIPSDETDSFFTADVAADVIRGSTGLYEGLARDLGMRQMIQPVGGYLPEEAVDGVTMGLVGTFDAADLTTGLSEADRVFDRAMFADFLEMPEALPAAAAVGAV